MKKLSISFVLILMLCSFTSSAEAGNNPEVRNQSSIIENLTLGIESGNEGLRISSAYVLGQLIDKKVIEGNKASNTLIPLLRMLTNGKTDEEKIVAAFSLFKMENSIGIFRLGGAAKYDKSERVKKLCKLLYYCFHNKNGSLYLCDFFN